MHTEFWLENRKGPFGLGGNTEMSIEEAGCESVN
jgi:hypothetical protein